MKSPDEVKCVVLVSESIMQPGSQSFSCDSVNFQFNIFSFSHLQLKEFN